MTNRMSIETAPKDGTIFDVFLEDASEDDKLFYCEASSTRSKDWAWIAGKFRPHIEDGWVQPTFVVPTHWDPSSVHKEKYND